MLISYSFASSFSHTASKLTLSPAIELDRHSLVHVLVQIKDILLLALATVFGASTASVTSAATSTTATTTATGSEVAAFRHSVVFLFEMV
jgi:hypothetical protein